MDKRRITINGCDIGSLEVGKRANVFKNGVFYITSPVVYANVSGGKVYIETQNTIYITE